MNALVVSAVVRDADIHVVDRPRYVTQRKKFAKKWGDGVALRLRIEPEDEAVTYGQFKYLFGFVFGPVAEFGHTDTELCLMAKVKFFPDDGRTSLTQLTREEMDAFTKQAEEWLRTDFPDAYLLYDETGRR